VNAAKLAKLEAAQAQMQGTLRAIIEQIGALRAVVFDSNSKFQEALDQKAADRAITLQQLASETMRSYISQKSYLFHYFID